ncbi:MAG: hypothetical protein H6623_07750 [Bdellovibrionaceae bacterium]|nr:hypothetical protein [Pseudobdellovibrionaceae bacterium]
MKHILFIVSSIVFVSLNSFAEEGESYKIKLDWNNKNTLNESVTQLCDDANYVDVQVEIPGKPYKDFYIQMNIDITKGTPELGCSIKVTPGANSTTYTFEADSNCSIRVDKVRKDLSETPQHANYDINDAC